METMKKEAINCLNSLPDNVDYEDMIYRLYVLEKINRGKEDIQLGNILSQDDARKESSKW